MWGVQSGDVTSTRAVVWARTDRPSRMIVEWSGSPAFTAPRRVIGPWATPDTDLIGKVALEALPSSTRIHYRVRFEAERASDWLAGALSTPDALADGARAASPSDVVFAWSGDTNGQGWGIDPSRGGMPAHTALLDRAPDFFVSCGDAIYADNPIPPEIALPDGSVWRNLVTPAKSHIAETLDDFRGAQLYPRHSAEVRALSANLPRFAIWDDHEVRDNWFPDEVVDERERREPRMRVTSQHARRAMLEHWPTLVDPERMYRSVRWGPLLEVFFHDGRRLRTPNYPVPADGKE
jgi:alkaline phosphatase D